ncbi:MAG: glycosyltransferase family 4 protein [Planctomycetaceae bacterium]|nr:glycosyltransferase family 4 protein [Planctomycetaceae bacterium]
MKPVRPSKPRALLIGPLPRAGQPIGGAQVSFRELCDGFRTSGTFEIDVLDTTRGATYSKGWRRTLGNALALARVLLSLLRRGARADVVVFNASVNGLMDAGPWVQRACRALGRPLVVRAFGGALDLAQAGTTPARRARLTELLASSALVLLQTEQLCAHFSGSGALRRLPTTRPLPSQVPSGRANCRRFLFLAQLRPEKGYEEALGALELCPADCTLDLYGPALPATDLSRLRAHPRAKWHGELEHRDVARVLAEHDALLFPSRYEGEGLPGAIVEAFQHGLPVIATRWRALPELVRDHHNGLLVPVGDVAALANAMARMAEDASLFRNLRAGALASGRELDSTRWQSQLEGWLLDLCARPDTLKSPTPHCSEVAP